MFDMSVPELLKLIWPLIVFQVILMVIGLRVLIKAEKVKYLPKLVWGLIIVICATIGPIIFLAVGRESDVQ